MLLGGILLQEGCWGDVCVLCEMTAWCADRVVSWGDIYVVNVRGVCVVEGEVGVWG